MTFGMKMKNNPKRHYYLPKVYNAQKDIINVTKNMLKNRGVVEVYYC